MDFNREHREKPISKLFPKPPKKPSFLKKNQKKSKPWWEKKEPESVLDKTSPTMSLAEKILHEEKLQKMKDNSCVDTAIQNYNVELSDKAKLMVKYMDKYLKKDKSLYQKIVALEENKDIKAEFCDYEWALLIEQAWIMAYKKAMDDEYITLEERHELNSLYSLAKRHKSNLYNQPQMRRKILDKFKVLNAIDNKYAIENRYEDDGIWNKKYNSVPKQVRYYRRLPSAKPKLTPYSDGGYGYR